MAASVYDIPVNRIDGKAASLGDYKGKVVLVVNVASKCGLTPQYDGLEKLYETYGDKGLVVTGFPANEFGAQEPGSNAEIADFCETRFNIKFPMFEKIVEHVPPPALDPGECSRPAMPAGRPCHDSDAHSSRRDGAARARAESRQRPGAGGRGARHRPSVGPEGCLEKPPAGPRPTGFARLGARKRQRLGRAGPAPGKRRCPSSASAPRRYLAPIGSGPGRVPGPRSRRRFGPARSSPGGKSAG